MSGVVSGLYIEMVWSYDEEAWNSYILWIQSKIDEFQQNYIC